MLWKVLSSERWGVDLTGLLTGTGGDVRAKNKNGWTPLRVVAEYGHEDVVRVLLEKGADVSTTGNDGLTPLSAASRHGHESTVMLLRQP
jgi:ankyrin repeat protein